MSLLGTYIAIMMGPTVPVPASPEVMESLDRIEVTHSDEGRSGFQITFRVGRGRFDALDYALLMNSALAPFSRVVLIVTFGAMPRVLMDGIITTQQLNPGTEPGTSTLTVSGEDVSVMMDLEERSVEHPAQPELVIANKIIASYAQYGLIPLVIPPPSLDVPLPIDRTPVQQESDLGYLRTMASRFGYVFYVSPGPAPLTSTAYWGPPVRTGIPQTALNVNMGPDTNVMEGIDFEYNSLGPEFTSGTVVDRNLNQAVPVKTFASTRIPLVSRPAWLVQSRTRSRVFRASGLNTMQAYAQAQGQTDSSTDNVLTCNGRLDATRYESLLQPRALVGLRGVGYSYDGFYYVKRVTHSIERGSYEQQFTLTREGLGSITPVLP